jgi:hypothetical protein
MIRTLVSIIFMVLSLILLIPVLIILLPIRIFVFLCTVVEKLLISSNTSWQDIIQYEPEIGWKPVAGLKEVTYYNRSGDRGSITTDEEGWPCSYSMEESDLVVFGDSFAFGFGDRSGKTYYGQSRDIRIKPIAAPSYNMVQSFLLMKKYRNRFKGKPVVWLICMENDLSENIRFTESRSYTNPFLRKNPVDDTWEVVTSHVQSAKWLYGEHKSHNTLRFATLCTDSPYSDRVFSACEFLIREAGKLCRSAGSELLIFTIPYIKQLNESGLNELRRRLRPDSTLDPDLPDKRIEQICRNLNTDFMAGKSFLSIKDYQIRDNHWNAKGNRMVSEQLSQYYRSIREIRSETVRNEQKAAVTGTMQKVAEKKDLISVNAKPIH